MSDLLKTLQLLGDAEIDDLSIAHDALEEIVGLRMRLTAAEADAGRYRWLRNNGNIKWSLDYDDMIISFEADPRITEADAAGLDAAIDAARGVE